MKALQNSGKATLKRILSTLLVCMLMSGVLVTSTASAQEGNESDGEYYTYYFFAPEDWFTAGDSIGLYYFTPTENAKWPGVEISSENCVYYSFDHGRKVYKVQVWQENADTKDNLVTTPLIIFNSFVDEDGGITNIHFTGNINTEGYLLDDEIPYGSDTDAFPHYPEGFEIYNFNNMIYVPNTDIPALSEFSNVSVIKSGVWYYYYGNGEYGVERTKTGKSGNNITWEYDAVTHTLTLSGEGDMTDDFSWKEYNFYIENIVIGDKITGISKEAFTNMYELTTVKLGNSVSFIGTRAFQCCESLQEIIIPDSVRKIDSGAFSTCRCLEKVTFGNGLTDIGEDAFSECEKIENVIIPNGVKTIGDMAFRDCNGIKSIELPDSLVFIGGYSFSGCNSLKTVKIPKNVLSIGSGVFTGCAALLNIEVSDDNPEYCSSAGVLYNKDKTILLCCPGTRVSIIIPDTVKEIAPRAFLGCEKLKSVTFPIGLERINRSAFKHCKSLESIVLPEGLKDIGEYAFDSCLNLKEIIIPSSVNNIGLGAFNACDNLTIYADRISYAYEYAQDNHIRCVSIIAALGDVNGDSDVNMEDVVQIQKHIAKLLELDPIRKRFADFNNSGDITMADVTTMQKYIAKLVSSF
ncbi:MAG: leucine-rich repeat protein [Clostridiales bacterium]|nr:leucine-rich repeat protein [Clostridiales bacterium]